MKQYSEKDLHDLINKVETEFALHLAKAETEAKEQKLEKAEVAKCGEIKKADEAKDILAEEKAPVEAPIQEEQAEQPKDQIIEDHGYSEDEKAELHKLYAEMSDTERALHKQALEACESKDGMLEKSETKTETVLEEKQESEELKLAKSEIEQLKKSNEDLQNQFQELVKSLNKKLVKPAPTRKAITELAVLEKSEKEVDTVPKSKTEIVKILGKKAREESLKKSDRDAINAYVVGSAGLETISHLLK
jgi:hypothetical protein